MIPLGGSSAPVAASDHSNTTTSAASHASVFGIVFTLDPDVGTTAFICFVIGLVVVEYFVEKLETMAEHRGLNSLFQKLQKELMMMGIISFCVFVYETIAHPPAGSILLEAMEMTHILVLFMALAFIAQAVFIVIYATVAGKKYLSIMRTSSESLVESYRQLENNPRMSWWFHYGSSMLPGTCPLRSRVETRIIERLFVNEHRLPPEFNFAQYISILFETYTAELGEVTPLSWTFLASLVVANYFRAAVIDHGTHGDEKCAHHAGEEHGVASYECQVYLVVYSYIAAAFLTVMIIGLYIASSIYVDKIVVESLKLDSITPEKGKERFSYIKSLECMVRKDNMLAYQDSIRNIAMKQKSKKLKVDGLAESGKSYMISVSSILDAIKLFKRKDMFLGEMKSHKGGSVSALIKSIRGSAKILSGAGEAKENSAELNKSEAENEVPDWLTHGGDEHGHGFGFHRKKLKTEKSLSKIFFLSWPSLFFVSVDAALLFQCFYISIAVTQLIPVVWHWKGGGGYNVIYLILILFNFAVITLIIDKSVILRSVFRLERDVAGKVCEDAIEIKSSIETFRNNVLAKFLADGVPEENWKDELHDVFKEYDDDGSGLIEMEEFREILADLKIFMSRESFKFLWQALDFDLSGELTWDELLSVVFPETKNLEFENKTLQTLKTALQTMLAEQDILVAEWEEFMRGKFMEFDNDGSGEIDQKEFAAMLKSLNVEIPDSVIPEIFHLVDQDGDEGLISYDEFWNIVFPSSSRTRSASFIQAKTSADSPNKDKDKSKLSEKGKVSFAMDGDVGGGGGGGVGGGGVGSGAPGPAVVDFQSAVLGTSTHTLSNLEIELPAELPVDVPESARNV